MTAKGKNNANYKTKRRYLLKLCILGGGGFIGSHLLDHILTQTEHKVLAVDYSRAKIQHLLDHENLTFIQGDVYRQNLRDYVESSDLVVSLTAICNPAFYNTQAVKVIEANFTQPLEVAKICSETGIRLIQFSTSEVYGKTPAALGDARSEYVMNEEISPLILGPIAKQRWSYSCAKQLLERSIFALGQESGLNYTIIRPFNFIGPRMDYIPGIDGEGVPRVLACFMASLILNKPLQLVDGGVNKRVFTHIDDAVDAIMAIIQKPEKCRQKIFNVGSPGNEISIAGLAEKMLELYPVVTGKPVGNQCLLEPVSSEEFYGPGYDDSDSRMPDISSAVNSLNWKPVIDLQTALTHSISAYIEQYLRGEIIVA